MLRKRLYEQFARIGKSLSHANRLELIDLLCQGPRSVDSLAKESGMSVANTSQHLQILREAGLVKSRRDGLSVCYELADDSVCAFWLSLQNLGRSQLAEVDRLTRDYFDQREILEPVDSQALLSRLRDGDVVVLDVRPVEEFSAAHIAHAVSIPLPELEQRLHELPVGKEIIAYCRGPYCVMSEEAVRLLSKHGYKARRAGGGVVEWRASALPLKTGSTNPQDGGKHGEVPFHPQ